MPGRVWAEAAAVAAAAAVVLATLVSWRDDVGIPIDELHYIYAGNSYTRWLVAPAPDDSTARRQHRDAAWRPNNEHPPLAKVAFGVSARLTAPKLGRPAGYRLASMVMFTALAVGLYAAARRVWGPVAGCGAALSLVVSPRLVGHAQVACLDLPAAAMCFAAAMAFLLAPRGKLLAAGAGVLLGLAFATKLNAFLLPPAFALWAVAYRRRDQTDGLAAMVLVAPAVLVLVWPWLWAEPVGRLADYLSFHGRQWKAPTWYFGQRYQESPAPWHYPLVMTAITLPAPVVGLTLVGVGKLVRDRLRDRFGGFALLLAALPLLAVTSPAQNKYDGERTFLSAFPFLFLLAGLGLSVVVRRLARRRLPAALLVAALFVPLTVQVVRQHPYELNFYGALVGGMRGALASGFESTNWGAHTVNPDLLRWLDDNLPLGATVDSDSGAFGPLRYYQAVGRLRPDIRFARGARYWVLPCQQAYGAGDWWWQLYHDTHPAYRRIHQVQKNGVPLVNVFERR